MPHPRFSPRPLLAAAAVCGFVALSSCAAAQPSTAPPTTTNPTTAATGAAATGSAATEADTAASAAATAAAKAGATASPTAASTPSVKVSKGASANYTTNPPGICTHSSCAWVMVTTAGFAKDTSCTLTWPDGSKAGTWTQGANETRKTKYYFGYPGEKLKVTCGGVTGTIVWS